MRPKNYKGRCLKRTLSKCDGVVKTYDEVQYAFADLIQSDRKIVSFSCNVPLDGDYTTDFVCTKTDGDLMVRECVYRKTLGLPRTCRLLDQSLEYWTNHGVNDWGIVIERSNENEKE